MSPYISNQPSDYGEAMALEMDGDVKRLLEKLFENAAQGFPCMDQFYSEELQVLVAKRRAFELAWSYLSAPERAEINRVFQLNLE